MKAVRCYHDNPSSYPKFSPNKQFKVELYFLSREDEGNYFYDKNQRPKPTAKSKAYDLTTLDDLSLLAKKVISKSSALKENKHLVGGHGFWQSCDLFHLMNRKDQTSLVQSSARAFARRAKMLMPEPLAHEDRLKHMRLLRVASVLQGEPPTLDVHVVLVDLQPVRNGD